MIKELEKETIVITNIDAETIEIEEYNIEDIGDKVNELINFINNLKENK